MSRLGRFISILTAAALFASMQSCAGAGAGTETSAGTADGEQTPAVTETQTPEQTALPQTEELTGEHTGGLAPRSTDSVISVLFIGNSFSYYNDMNKQNGIFANIAKNAGYSKVRVRAVYKGGYYLRQFLDGSDEYGRQVLALLNSSSVYDIVIIQEQSANPINHPDDFFNSVRKFKELTDKNGGELWLYSTWGYKTGYSSLSKYGGKTAIMEMKLRAAYTAIAEELGIGVAYAGAAMTKSFQENPSVDLYNADLKHPSEAGSYLVAWTLFGTIFGVDPATLTYNGSLQARTADALRAVASDIVTKGVTVDEKYRISSSDF